MLTRMPPVLLPAVGLIRARQFRRHSDVIQEQELPAPHVGADREILEGDRPVLLVSKRLMEAPQWTRML